LATVGTPVHVRQERFFRASWWFFAILSKVDKLEFEWGRALGDRVRRQLNDRVQNFWPDPLYPRDHHEQEDQVKQE